MTSLSLYIYIYVYLYLNLDLYLCTYTFIYIYLFQLEKVEACIFRFGLEGHQLSAREAQLGVVPSGSQDARADVCGVSMAIGVA